MDGFGAGGGSVEVRNTEGVADKGGFGVLININDINLPEVTADSLRVFSQK